MNVKRRRLYKLYECKEKTTKKLYNSNSRIGGGVDQKDWRVKSSPLRKSNNNKKDQLR